MLQGSHHTQASLPCSQPAAASYTICTNTTTQTKLPCLPWYDISRAQGFLNSFSEFYGHMWVLKLLRTLACFCIKFKDNVLLYFVVIFSCVSLSLSTSCLGLFPSISVHICYLFLHSYACPPVLMRPQCFWFNLFSLGFSQTFLCLPFVARSFDLGFWTCRFIINSHLYFFDLPALPVSTFGSSLLCSSLHYGSFKCIIVSPLAETVLVWVSDSMLKYHWHYGLHNVCV